MDIFSMKVYVEMTLVLLHMLLIVDGGRMKNKTRNPRKKHFHYEDCGTDPDRPIHVVSVTARPGIVRSPGRLKLSVRLNVTRQLPDHISMDVTMSKYVFGVPFRIPCYKNVGTCQYKDVCGFLGEAFKEGCPGPLVRRGLPCTCPFLPGEYSMRRLLVRIPRMDGMFTSLAMGKYEGSIRLQDEYSGAELGCINLSFTMKYKKNSHRKRRLFQRLQRYS